MVKIMNNAKIMEMCTWLTLLSSSIDAILLLFEFFIRLGLLLAAGK